MFQVCSQPNGSPNNYVELYPGDSCKFAKVFWASGDFDDDNDKDYDIDHDNHDDNDNCDSLCNSSHFAKVFLSLRRFPWWFWSY